MEQDNELFHFFYQIRKINLFGKVRKYREKSATNYFQNPTRNFRPGISDREFRKRDGKSIHKVCSAKVI